MTFSGVLNIDKPTGMTSREVVDRILRLVRPSKVGHAGTLDPLATGVLVVCVGHATRLINFVQEGRKRYSGRFRLGQRSDTDDVMGQITEGGDWSQVTRERIEERLPDFLGHVQQVPPQFSAVHVNGQRAYDLARRGQKLELDARSVDIHQIAVTAFEPPEFELAIECGSGTYVRSIGRDLGLQLGCGAIMTQLRRLSVGSFSIDDAVAIDAINRETLGQFLLPAIKIVADFPQRTLSESEVMAVRQGQSLAAQSGTTDSGPLDPAGIDQERNEPRTVLIGPDGHFVGIGLTDPAAKRLQPKIIFPA